MSLVSGSTSARCEWARQLPDVQQAELMRTCLQETHPIHSPTLIEAPLFLRFFFSSTIRVTLEISFARQFVSKVSVNIHVVSCVSYLEQD